MPASFYIPNLKASASRRPEGFVDCLLARGKIEGDYVHLDDQVIEDIQAQFPNPQAQPPARRGKAAPAPPTGTKFHIPQIKAAADQRAEGYLEFVLGRGKIEGDYVILDDAALREVRKKFPPPPPRPKPPMPTVAEMATNFSGAMAAWAKAGFKVADRKVYETRFTLCQACEYWDAKAWAGSGRCRKCGCSRAKLWLATSKCPLQPPKW